MASCHHCLPSLTLLPDPVTVTMPAGRPCARSSRASAGWALSLDQFQSATEQSHIWSTVDEAKRGAVGVFLGLGGEAAGGDEEAAHCIGGDNGIMQARKIAQPGRGDVGLAQAVMNFRPALLVMTLGASSSVITSWSKRESISAITLRKAEGVIDRRAGEGP
jgi:hypothetical protein